MNNFETIQKGNPYRLTKEQHFIPSEHIKRFYNQSNKIYLKNLKTKNKKTVCVDSNDQVFKVQRLWAEFAEKGYMKDIEDKFHQLVDAILENKIQSFSDEHNTIICNMYTLWERRVFHIENFLSHQLCSIELNGIPHETYTKDEREKIESMHMSYCHEGKISNRDIVAGQIQIDILNSPYKSIEWGILQASEKDFIMPSNPIMNQRIIFPISPDYALVPNKVYQKVDSDDVKRLNRLLRDNAKWFYFGNKLEV